MSNWKIKACIAKIMQVCDPDRHGLNSISRDFRTVTLPNLLRRCCSCPGCRRCRPRRRQGGEEKGGGTRGGGWRHGIRPLRLVRMRVVSRLVTWWRSLISPVSEWKPWLSRRPAGPRLSRSGRRSSSVIRATAMTSWSATGASLRYLCYTSILLGVNGI